MLRIMWLYINWCKYWRVVPIFRKIYYVILNLVGGRLEKRVKIDCVRRDFLGEGSLTAYVLERLVEGSHTQSKTLLHIWFKLEF